MGLILISGPSGSGKTTVVMTLVQHLASPNRKVVTIEDPVYPRMENVTQVEVAEHRGMTTSALLSRIVRLDPDIVAVHTINDNDVAAKSAAVALGGSLVMSGFHANDAIGAVASFTEMLGDRDLAASLLIGATNQRLLRRICDECREEYTPSVQALQSLHLEPSSVKYEHGAGCEKCNNTGYFGRTTIMEVLEMNRELMDLLLAGSDPAMFRARARAATTPTLVDDGRRKVLSGTTTPEEVCRVIPLPR
jgi:type II secretory ATPase GspE/PulE/Tfp pilus assembly ATPase PilB-like protein